MDKIILVYKEFTSFEGSLFKYALSFSFLLAIAPSILLFSMLFRFAYLPIEIVLYFVKGFLADVDPETLDQIFLFFADKDYSVVNFIITAAISFYLASRSIFSFLLISATHEEVTIPKWSIRIKAVLMFVVLTLIILIGAFWIVQMPQSFSLIIVVLLNFLFVVFYRVLSFRRRRWYYGIIGGMFSTLSMLILYNVFVMIVRLFTSYQDVYGPIAVLVTSLLAIYLISCIIYLGFCINIVYAHEYGKEGLLPLKYAIFFGTCLRIQNWISSKLK